MTRLFGARGLFFRLFNRFVLLLDPNTGSCYRCRGSWSLVRRHETFYQFGRVCVALCEHCWITLDTVEARLPYYHNLFDDWNRHHPTKIRTQRDIDDITSAVKSESGE